MIRPMKLGSLIFLASLMVFQWGCQKPEKKTSDASVYNEGISQLELLYQSLKNKGLELNSDQLSREIEYADTSKGHRTFPKIQNFLKPEHSIDEVKTELTKFVIAAEKLLSLGNSKTVVFPEKEKIMKQNYIASFFLADIFQSQKFNSENEPGQISKSVDHHEFIIRFARFGANLKKLKDAGFPIGEETYELPNKNHEWAIHLYQEGISDALRMKTLIDRTDGFQTSTYDVFKTFFFPAAGYFHDIIAKLSKPKKTSGYETLDSSEIIRSLLQINLDLNSMVTLKKLSETVFTEPKIENLIHPSSSLQDVRTKLELYLELTEEDAKSNNAFLSVRRLNASGLLAQIYLKTSLKSLPEITASSIIEIEKTMRLQRWMKNEESVKDMQVSDRKQAVIKANLFAELIRDVQRLSQLESQNQASSKRISDYQALTDYYFLQFKDLIQKHSLQEQDLSDAPL